MREKRGLEGGEDELPERKRPALARYIIYFCLLRLSITCVLVEGFFSFFCSLFIPSPFELNLATGEK